MCVCETWLSSDISSSEIFIPSYSLFRKDRNRHGGGVAIFIKSSLSPLVISLPTSSIELLLISFIFNNRRLNIGCFYGPPSQSSSLSDLTSLLSSLGPALSSNLILVGDFNINALSPSNNLSSFSDFFSLRQLVSSPTHFSHSGSPSVIDLAFVPSSLSFSSSHASVLSPVGSSDHNTIMIDIPLPYHHSSH